MFLGSVTTTSTYTYEGLSLLSMSVSRSDGTTAAVTYMHDEAGRAFAGVYAGQPLSSYGGFGRGCV